MNELRKWREGEKVTLQQLAEEIEQELRVRDEPPNKFSKQQLSNYETGKYKPQEYVMKWLALNAHNERVQRFARFALDILIRQKVEN